LRLGFVPLTDCAPLVLAHELGLFAKYDLQVELHREVGWASMRDRLIFGDLDAAHALATMPFAATLGLRSIPCDSITGLVLSLHGNAITLSRELRDKGVRDARTLRQVVDRARGHKIYTFGVVLTHSSHNFLLRQWLASAGLEPDRDVRIVVVPPPSMFENLRFGNLDGYCVGEPWNSLAVQAGFGWCASTSAQLAPGHPEKVLMVKREFAETHASEHLRLIAALLEACAFCDAPENHEQIIETLARPDYVNAPPEALRAGLVGPFDFGFGRSECLPDFQLFSRQDANEPSAEKAAWVVNNLVAQGAVREQAVRPMLNGHGVFRLDLFQEARQLVRDLAGNVPLPVAEQEFITC
jgi:ABC-type nitrate/sulfonate/bicarbonate transport system substrate-binding protein